MRVREYLAYRARLEGLTGPDPAADFWEAEFRQHLVGRALELMRADFQPATWQAFWQHRVAGRPAAAVAAELGVSVNAVYLATSRVQRRLQQAFGMGFEIGGDADSERCLAHSVDAVQNEYLRANWRSRIVLADVITPKVEALRASELGAFQFG